MSPKTLRQAILLLTLVLFGSQMYGQILVRQVSGSELNSINTAIPFITIAPDSRSGGMGDVGVASLPDVSSQHWNSAKYAFIDTKGGFSVSYTPWLRKIIPDINLLYTSGYYKINDKSTVSASMRYFSLGSINFTTITGVSWGQFTPFEMAFDAGYSRKFSEHFSGGVVFRYIHSDLTSGHLLSGEESKPGKSLAADLGLYYENDIWIGDQDFSWALGMNISNAGTPISYTADAAKVPIPSNLRIGGRLTYHYSWDHSISLMADANKLMVPTPPYVRTDTLGVQHILFGREAPETILAGMIQSFYDAPGLLYPDGTRGTVFREELAEIMLSIGAEYWYRGLYAARMGYFYEHVSKGNRKYLSLGVGLRRGILTLDASYLIPTNGQLSPLANTVRIMATFEFNHKAPDSAQ